MERSKMYFPDTSVCKTNLLVSVEELSYNYKLKYRTNIVYPFYLIYASIIISKEFYWSRSTQDPALFTGLLSWPYRFSVFET